MSAQPLIDQAAVRQMPPGEPLTEFPKAFGVYSEWEGGESPI